MRTKGKIISWNEEKGFGFIAPVAGGKQIFIHVTALNNRSRRPEVDQIVTYTVSSDKQGRPCAIKATLDGDRSPEKTKRKQGSWSIDLAAFFLVIVGFTVLIGRIPLQILMLYMIVSLLTFIMYALDKSAARKGAWRTQESTLHLLSLAGGWPGALIAQQKLRHKSRKQSFRAVFWVTLLLNCGAFAWLFTPEGAAKLQLVMQEIPPWLTI
ncbi:MAG: cold shock and DUF1294 domain-containing protein [Gammaproteobacteria bacterium]|nr:cold shock and DUF1294 domain-containing protein [Gammaproteobacteria bacterium]